MVVGAEHSVATGIPPPVLIEYPAVQATVTENVLKACRRSASVRVTEGSAARVYAPVAKRSMSTPGAYVPGVL